MIESRDESDTPYDHTSMIDPPANYELFLMILVTPSPTILDALEGPVAYRGRSMLAHSIASQLLAVPSIPQR